MFSLSTCFTWRNPGIKPFSKTKTRQPWKWNGTENLSKLKLFVLSLTFCINWFCNVKCSMVPAKGAFVLKSVVQDAHRDAQLQHTRNHACSSAKSVVPSACVCLQALTATNNLALATIIGRPREEAPNALRFLTIYIYVVL
ncbi:hypothetical protein J1N35_001814 [Gossypium stocksii]|uniref:Uncharacterized protein n=1 Tax=Gossypium stocksii TaxID=47602 RepID=A0A9D3WK71_9ROSI|nr:hypothetical protein J1N35_001814 [Gossypium stocksii]